MAFLFFMLFFDVYFVVAIGAGAVILHLPFVIPFVLTVVAKHMLSYYTYPFIYLPTNLSTLVCTIA
jgi:uncharacterized membrane protein